MTKVFNLATGEEIVYSLDAKEAVNAAFEQYSNGKRGGGRGNFSTWNYPDADKFAITSKSGRTVSRGDWVALLN